MRTVMRLVACAPVLGLALVGCTPQVDEGPGYTLTLDQSLRAAVVRGDLDGVTAAIDAGADVDAGAMGTTALHIAVASGDAPMVRLLLDAGADPESSSVAHYRPIHLAAAEGVVDVVHALLQAGADPDALVSSRLDLGETALGLAAADGRLDAMAELVRGGADVDGRPLGNPPLTAAACAGQLAAVRLLVGWGADVDFPGPSGQTAVMCAIGENHAQVVAYLQPLETVAP